MFTEDNVFSFKPEVRLLTGKTAKASISQSSIFLHLLQLLHIQTQLKNNVCNESMASKYHLKHYTGFIV